MKILLLLLLLNKTEINKIVKEIFFDDNYENETKNYEKLYSNVEHKKNFQFFLSKGKVCNTKLLNSYNLFGLKYSISLKLRFFPSIKNSCCRFEDQKIIYQDFILNSEKNQIENSIKNILDIYYLNLDLNKRISIFARDLDLRHMKHDIINNCTVLSKRILEFKVSNLQKYLIIYLHELKLFLKKVYNSFYSILCDYDSRKYFHFEDKTIWVSMRFCSKLLKKTIKFLYYNYIFFPDFFNLYSYFINSCDKKGNFKEYNRINEIKFHKNNLLSGKIRKCYVSRNKIDWQEHCMFICNKFNIVYFDSFFFGNYIKINELNEVLKRAILINKIDYINNEYNNYRILWSSKRRRVKMSIDMMDRKILEDSLRKLDFSNKKEKEIINQNLKFFSGNGKSMWKLEHFSWIFSNNNGVDFEESGRHISINKSNFKLVIKDIKNLIN